MDPEIRKRFFHVIIMNSTGIPLPRPSRGSSDFSHRPRSSPGSCSHGLTQSPRPRRNRIPRLPQGDDPLKIRHSDSAPRTSEAQTQRHSRLFLHGSPSFITSRPEFPGRNLFVPLGPPLPSLSVLKRLPRRGFQ